MTSTLRRLALLFVLAAAAEASACPDFVKTLRTSHLAGHDLCEVFDRYQTLKVALERREITPVNRIGNLMAPRFIKLDTWEAKRNGSSTRAWTVYEPAPTTWGNWDKVASMVDEAARKNFERGMIPNLTFGDLAVWHAFTVVNLETAIEQLRRYPDFGLAGSKAFALTESQATVVSRDPLLEWTPLLCLEDQPEATKAKYGFNHGARPIFQASDWKTAKANEFFSADDGQRKQCGFITYPGPWLVRPQLEALIVDVNYDLDLLRRRASTKIDFLILASRLQRGLVRIHPYASGNGRLSRFAMDWLLESAGLPAPILADMDLDLYMTDKMWADQIGQGLLRALDEGQKCLVDPKRNGCAPVSNTPTMTTADKDAK